MRSNVMVLGLANVLASWHSHADDTAATASATADGSTAVEQVVISGDKLKRTEIDSSAGVGSRNGRQISESGTTTLQDVARQTANVGTAGGLPLRGINSYGPAGGGRTITMVVDGVQQDGYGQDISALSVWDADRVEVLRGPQSTNQGRNSLAGTVVLGRPGVAAVTRPIEARQNLSNDPRNADNLTRSAALEQTFKAGGQTPPC